MADRRPDNREVENENLRPRPTKEGPPRPATEPEGAERSSQSDRLTTDPGTGAQKS